MKVWRIYFLISFLIISTSCSKEKTSLNQKLIGNWFVEHVTIYEGTYSNYDEEASKHYTNVGSFTFNDDGTGRYVFVDSVDFTYSVSENRCYFEFDVNDIYDQQSPIIKYYLPIYDYDVSSYEVFTGTANTAKLSYTLSGGTSYYSLKKLEVLLTRID